MAVAADPRHPPEVARVSGRQTVADTVHHQLRQALILGRFDPGQMLTVAALAQGFGTSPMPVREALARLGAEHALDIRSNGSAYVPPATRALLDDICEARVLIERAATERAAGAITGEELAALERQEAAHVATAHLQDIAGMLERNRDFHLAIYRAARSAVLPALIDSLWLRYGPFMRLLSRHLEPRLAEGAHEPFMAGHRRIVAALRARDAAAAGAAAEADIRGTQSLLRRLLG